MRVCACARAESSSGACQHVGLLSIALEQLYLINKNRSKITFGKQHVFKRKRRSEGSGKSDAEASKLGRAKRPRCTSKSPSRAPRDPRPQPGRGLGLRLPWPKRTGRWSLQRIQVTGAEPEGGAGGQQERAEPLARLRTVPSSGPCRAGDSEGQRAAWGAVGEPQGPPSGRWSSSQGSKPPKGPGWHGLPRITAHVCLPGAFPGTWLLPEPGCSRPGAQAASPKTLLSQGPG